MAGFQLNLKKRNGDQIGVSGKKPKLNFGSHKPSRSSEKSKPSGFVDDSDNEDTTVQIDSFNQQKGGALAGKNAVNKKTGVPLVITSKNLNTTIRKDLYTPNKEHDESEVIAAEEDDKKSKLKFGLTRFSSKKTDPLLFSTKPEPKQLSTEEQIRTSLLKGEQFHEANGLVIPIDRISNRNSDDSDDDPADYDKVPVEQFGAALLRGMGWKPKAPTKKLNDPLQNRQQGVLLGIGAKPVGADLIQDLHGKKGTVLQAPLLKREKASGKIIEEKS